MGASWGGVLLFTVISCLLLQLPLSRFCVNASSLGYGIEGTRLGAQSVAHNEIQLEHRMGKALLSDKKTLPLPLFKLQHHSAANATLEAHYKSNLELEAALRNFTQRCSHISRLYSIGNSTNGVPLWVVEISDKPGISEPEPAFKYVGNMHGDEPLGREFVLLLADWLCDNYLDDYSATMIVNKVHLHLLPSMNPDGFAATPTPTRHNPHEIDLNRDFPDQVLVFIRVQFFSENNDEKKRQAETRAVMSWIRSTHFTASASFHEGALVANYPWDGTPDTSTKYASSPDDSTFKYLAGLYAQNHPVMLKSKDFKGGITNGAAWYPLYGGMQDWNYLHGDCLELTLEMNDKKWPPPSQIPKLWNEHRKSLIELVAAMVMSGVHGRVMSSATGKPLAATIRVMGINHPSKASAEFGDYHRLLAPGEVYEVTASMVGYESRSTSIYLEEDSPVALDFILHPLQSNVEDFGHARLRGMVKNGTSTKAAPISQQIGAGREVINGPVKKPDEQIKSMEMLSWIPTRLNRKGLHSHALNDDAGYALLTQLLPLVAVAAALVWLLCRAKSGHRYQMWRQRACR